ncbi:hypothetical protein MAR_037877 [Mya arenaria]|uniref:Uncharacterized protein n=1 Tax=Mya arenaria TaxID=6604 RepID=A0ABY7FPR7_MYAAR|nr:hypothetical protein MAR_037877 [Mya arenaria]
MLCARQFSKTYAMLGCPNNEDTTFLQDILALCVRPRVAECEIRRGTSEFWEPIGGCLLFALLFSLFIISLMMVYGAIRNRPCYLLPFFFYQLYLINMVWLCYRYLQLRIINGRAVHEYTTEPDSELNCSQPDKRTLSAGNVFNAKPPVEQHRAVMIRVEEGDGPFP